MGSVAHRGVRRPGGRAVLHLVPPRPQTPPRPRRSHRHWSPSLGAAPRSPRQAWRGTPLPQAEEKEAADAGARAHTACLSVRWWWWLTGGGGGRCRRLHVPAAASGTGSWLAGVGGGELREWRGDEGQSGGRGGPPRARWGHRHLQTCWRARWALAHRGMTPRQLAGKAPKVLAFALLRRERSLAGGTRHPPLAIVRNGHRLMRLVWSTNDAFHGGTIAAAAVPSSWSLLRPRSSTRSPSERPAFITRSSPPLGLPSSTTSLPPDTSAVACASTAPPASASFTCVGGGGTRSALAARQWPRVGTSGQHPPPGAGRPPSLPPPVAARRPHGCTRGSAGTGPPWLGPPASRYHPAAGDPTVAVPAAAGGVMAVGGIAAEAVIAAATAAVAGEVTRRRRHGRTQGGGGGGPRAFGIYAAVVARVVVRPRGAVLGAAVEPTAPPRHGRNHR